MQYAASVTPDAGDFKLMSLLTGGQLQFRPLHAEFQKIKSPHGDFSLFADGPLFEKTLIHDFPHERKGIQAYFSKLRYIDKHFSATIMPRRFPRVLAVLATLASALPLATIAHKTLANRLDHYFSDEKLKFIFSSYWSAWGLPPKEAPFLIAGGVQAIFCNGIHVPIIADMTSGFVRTIENAGGAFRYGQAGQACSLLFDERQKKIIGVETADGNKHHAVSIVSDIGIKRTAESLLP